MMVNRELPILELGRMSIGYFPDYGVCKRVCYKYIGLDVVSPKIR